jgi:HD-like signal output (HDOD) protein
VALRLQQMMNDHSYQIEDAIILVHQDTALASEMLRYANNTYCSGKTPITTIKNAIVRLGSQQIVNLAFTASMASNKSGNAVINNYLKKLWQHCHAVAITSSWLAVQIKHDNVRLDIDADEVYLAGLLHSIGKLYLLKSMDKLISAGLVQVDEETIQKILEELSIEQGIKVMQHWNLPDVYRNSIERHRTSNWIGEANNHLVAAVRLSCKIHQCIMQGIEASDASNVVNDELFFLDMDDVSGVYDMMKAVA